MDIVRKLKNVSELEVPIQTDEKTTVYVHPGQTMENVQVHNLDSVRKHLKVEQDLTEVKPVNERIKLYD